MTPSLRIIDMVSEAGDPKRVNEDAAGGNRCSAFVIDGATGLGNKPLVGLEGSDAAWLARLAKTFFEQNVTPGRAIADVVRTLNKQVATVVREAAGSLPLAAWSLPVACFQLIRIEDGALSVYGLGDCRLFLVDADGAVTETTALKGHQACESQNARAAVALTGGLAATRSLSEHPEIREELRRSRARYNSEDSDVWTLGTEPNAARHVVCEKLKVELPATGLLCTDGFAALCDRYERYCPAELVARARATGLKKMIAELRTIEQAEDPDGRRYPRFKVSDDATALLFEIVD